MKKEKKRFVTSLTVIALMLVTLCALAYAASAAEISVVPAHQEVSKGENFSVDIYVDPEGNVTCGVEYLLQFNNTLLNATSLTPGNFFTGFGFDIMPMGEGINNSAGWINYGEAITGSEGGGVTTPGTFTTITFQAIGDYGTSELYFDETWTGLYNGGSILTNLNHGSVRIGICGDVDGLPGVTTNDGRQIFMHLLYGSERYPIANSWAADCDGLCDGITTNDGRQIFMNLLYGSDKYPLQCT